MRLVICFTLIAQTILSCRSMNQGNELSSESASVYMLFDSGISQEALDAVSVSPLVSMRTMEEIVEGAMISSKSEVVSSVSFAILPDDRRAAFAVDVSVDMSACIQADAYSSRVSATAMGTGVARKKIFIGKEGISTEPAGFIDPAQVSTRVTQTQSMGILGFATSFFVRNGFVKQIPKTNEKVRCRLESEVNADIDKIIDQALVAANKSFQREIIEKVFQEQLFGGRTHFRTHQDHGKSMFQISVIRGIRTPKSARAPAVFRGHPDIYFHANERLFNDTAKRLLGGLVMDQGSIHRLTEILPVSTFLSNKALEFDDVLTRSLKFTEHDPIVFRFQQGAIDIQLNLVSELVGRVAATLSYKISPGEEAKERYVALRSDVDVFFAHPVSGERLPSNFSRDFLAAPLKAYVLSSLPTQLDVPPIDMREVVIDGALIKEVLMPQDFVSQDGFLSLSWSKPRTR